MPRPSLDSPRGAIGPRYLTPALVAPPTTARIALTRAQPVVERHRFALVALLMLTSRNGQRVVRGVERACADALATLAKLTEREADRADAIRARLHDAIEAIEKPRRVPVILAVVTECLQTAPFARDLAAPCPWRALVCAVQSLRSAAGYDVAAGSLDAHAETAERIVAEVFA